ncbi:hypothetical protein M758_7G095500 [Ceratodon purpureus]|nr:hypothetical protein M758_7G095500 [Ceratodon purpureus]
MGRRWEDSEQSDGRSALYMTCSREHASVMLVRTSQGGAFCLECFVEIITSPSSLVVRRAKALTEISELLADSEFCGSLMQKRLKFLAAPLAEAIFFYEDEGLATGIIDVMVSICKLALENDDTLLQDLMLSVCSHLSSSETAPWKHGHLFSVHALSLLLELHCHQKSDIPHAIKSQPSCVENFVKALTLPTDEIEVNIFFILFKLSSLEGGIQLLAESCPSLVYHAIRALVKTQNDEVRTKSLDLLISLARASVFNISLSTASFQEKCDTSDSQKTAPVCHTGASFVEQFSEAMKATLLSSNTQVQIKSFVLIDQVCPTSLDISEELYSLVKEGLTDYIFEVLRVSEDLDAVATSAIPTLVTLSMAFPTFSDHFSLGLEPLLRVLEHSFSSAFGTLQKDTLTIIAAGIADRPGVVSVVRAEHLMNLLKKSFQHYKSVIKDHAVSDILGFGLSPEGLNTTCGTLTTLLRAPSCSNITSICPILQDCVSALIDCIVADPVYASQHNGLISAAHLLQETYLFSVQQNSACEQFTGLTDFLMNHFLLGVLPVLTATWESITDEETINTFFSTVKSMVQIGDASKTAAFARTLISKRLISMAFESMSKFPSENLKRNVYGVISTVINGIYLCGDLIQDVLLHLPADVEGLLVLLEQRSNEDMHVIAAHQAIIALMFTAIEYGDRLVDSNQLLSSLEQHLVVNASSSLLATPFGSLLLKQFFILFIDVQEDIMPDSRFRSMKAESIMLDILQAAYRSGSFDFELPTPALKWIVKKESLFSISKDLLLRHLESDRLEVHATIAQLVHEDDHVTVVTMSLFLDVVERHLVDEIRIVATGLSSIIRQNWNLAKKFHGHGVVSTLRRFILLQGSKAPQATVTSCVELLFQLLLILDESMAVMDEGAWTDIANQAVKLLLLQLDKRDIIHTSDVPLVNLVSLIMHNSTWIPTLQEAARKICMSKDLRDIFEQNILNASQKGSTLVTMDIDSDDGVTLSASLLFHVLWLRSVYNGTAFTDDRAGRIFSKDDSKKTLKDYSSRISCQQLCQLLCFNTHSMQKTLTSSCLVEILSHLTDSDGKFEFQGSLAECSVGYLRSVVLVLQGAAIGSNGLLRKNACICMIRLLATTFLNPKQQEAIARGPWYKKVAEELMLSLAQTEVNVMEKEEIHYSASMLSAMLCISPPYNWLQAVFNPEVLAAAVESFRANQHVTVGTVDFFLGLLKGGFLNHGQVEILRDIHQTVRRKCYRERSMALNVKDISPSGSVRQSAMDIVSKLDLTKENMGSSTLIMHLAIHDTKEHFVWRREDALLDDESLLLVKIDEFLERSV